MIGVTDQDMDITTIEVEGGYLQFRYGEDDCVHMWLCDGQGIEQYELVLDRRDVRMMIYELLRCIHQPMAGEHLN